MEHTLFSGSQLQELRNLQGITLAGVKETGYWGSNPDLPCASTVPPILSFQTLKDNNIPNLHTK